MNRALESGKGERGRNLGSYELTDRIIGAAIAVHTALGPGFLESIYEEALCVEFERSGISFDRQKSISVWYGDRVVGEHRLDLLVEQRVVVELKAVKEFETVHFAVVRSYLKALNLEDGLLLNFAIPKLTVRRTGRELPARDPA